MDLTDVLDGLLADPAIGPRLDLERIGAGGFSLGGYTVIELAGGLTDREAFLHFCNSERADAACTPPEMARAEAGQPSTGSLQSPQALKSVTRSGDSYRDPRIKAVFAMAPALGEAFSRAGLAQIRLPVNIVAGSGDITVPLRTNAIRYSKLLPSAKLTILPGGVSHYTFTGTCLSAGLEMLPEACRDNPGVDRDEVHEKVSAMALEFFDRSLHVAGIP
jgi:predicted dienelactone hydrolase